MQSVAPNSLGNAMNHVANGGRLCVATYARTIVIDAKVVAKFARVGLMILKAEGDGYRMRSGKGSVYLLPGQLKYID